MLLNLYDNNQRWIEGVNGLVYNYKPVSIHIYVRILLGTGSLGMFK